MKSVLIEILFVGQAILFWSLVLPAAAVFLAFATLWKKISTPSLGEPFTPTGARLSGASA